MNQILTPLGLTVVVASIIIGYTAHGGNLSILWQPTEFIIIGIRRRVVSACPVLQY